MNQTSAIAPLLAVLLTAGHAVAGFQAEPPLLRWFAKVNDAMELLPEPRSYRIFQSPRHIAVALGIANESTSPLAFDVGRFSSAVAIRLTGPVVVAVRAELQPTIRRSQSRIAEPVTESEFIQVEPGASVGLEFYLVRVDGEVFAPGNYNIEVSLAGALSSVSTIDGAPWRGRAMANTALHVAIAAPERPQEVAKMYQHGGVRAVVDGDSQTAIDMLSKAIAADPSDVQSKVWLGHAYLQQNRYRDVIELYERVLPQVSGVHGAVPELLALAYIAVNDELSAERVLRRIG